MGLGFGLSFGAGGGADALRQIEQDKLARLDMQNRAELTRQALLRQMTGDAEQRRQFDLSHDLAERNAKSLAEQRAAAASKAQADAERAAARTAGLERLVSDPTALQNLTPVQRIVALGQLGVGNVGVHDLESPTEHGAHVKADKDSAFADWQRRQDYSNAHRPSAGEASTGRAIARLRMDDPSLPRGVQDYLVQLRTKYPSFDAAAGEFSGALDSLRSAHPSLSSTKALTALRQQYSGGGNANTGDDELDALVSAVMNGAEGAPVAGGGRASGPGAAPAPARIRTAAPAGGGQPAGPKGTVSLAELEAIARRRGTSVEVEKQRASASGFVVR